MNHWLRHRRVYPALAGTLIAGMMIWYLYGLFTTNATCQRTAAAVVIEHLRTHHDAWPKSWEDLRDDYQVVAKRRRSNPTIEQVKRRVGIVWDVDTETLKAVETGSNGDPPFHVIWALDGSSDIETWDGLEPN